MSFKIVLGQWTHGSDIHAINIVSISRPAGLRYYSLAQQNFYDIDQYCKKGVIFGHFLQYWQYRKNLCCANASYQFKTVYTQQILANNQEYCPWNAATWWEWGSYRGDCWINRKCFLNLKERVKIMSTKMSFIIDGWM